MRILFITSNRVGDAVLSTGLLDHLIRRYPHARITVACGPAAEGVFLRMPNLERLILVPKRRHGAHWPLLWARTAAHWWDLVVDIRASLLAYLVPAARRAVRRSRADDRSRHKTAQLADLLRLTPPPLPVAWTAPEDRALALRLLPPGPPVIALGPTANWTGKLWPPDRFVALFRALAHRARPGARAAVLAGPGEHERALAAPVLTALPQAIDLAGRLSLPEAAACLARADLFVGNDSGLMHLAAASGTPTLGLFGPTAATEYAPAGARAMAVLADAATMESLSLERVLAAAERMLRPGSGGGFPAQ